MAKENPSADELLKKCFEDSFDNLETLFEQGRRISDNRFKKNLHCFVPGMVYY